MPPSKRSIVNLLVVDPLRVIARNASVLIPVGVVIFLNYASNFGDGPKIDFSNEWLFVRLPEELLQSVLSRTMILLGLMFFVAQTLATIVVAQDMTRIFLGCRASLGDSIRRIRSSDVLWFLAYELAVWFVFGLFALACYVSARAAWMQASVNGLIPLAVVFVVLYPVFYICLSAGSMVAVLPISSRERLSLLRIFLRWRNGVKMYSFYFVRLTVETILMIVVPAFAIALLKSYFLAVVSAIAGMAIPYSFLRGSAYELKLDILRDESVIQELFAIHFARY